MIIERDRELARKALQILLACDAENQIEHLAPVFALARHSGAQDAIEQIATMLVTAIRGQSLADANAGPDLNPRSARRETLQ